MNIEKLITMMQQMELLDSLENSVSYGQTPDFMLQDRSASQGVMSEDKLFNTQGSSFSYGNKNTSENEYDNIPTFDKPISEQTPVTFSDFFGNPTYNYENSIMMPRKEDIDD
tara:strand:- start:124 stop:459 length:336 start_codon:yes stop_codon:yes gene_type:complete